jgi:hypothetical protein
MCNEAREAPLVQALMLGGLHPEFNWEPAKSPTGLIGTLTWNRFASARRALTMLTVLAALASMDGEHSREWVVRRPPKYWAMEIMPTH